MSITRCMFEFLFTPCGLGYITLHKGICTNPGISASFSNQVYFLQNGDRTFSRKLHGLLSS